MSTPTQHDRIEISRYTYARSSLVEAREAAKLLVAHPEFQDDIKQAVVYQIVIAYARPFTKSQVTDSNRILPLTSPSSSVIRGSSTKKKLEMPVNAG
jgi:hypothetical protein